MKNEGHNPVGNPKMKAFIIKLLEREQKGMLNPREKDILNLWEQNRMQEVGETEIKLLSDRIWDQINEQLQATALPQLPVVDKPHRPIAYKFYRVAVAALFILGLLSVFIYYNNKGFTPFSQQQSDWVAYTTGTNELKTIVLPDGSKISLNHATTVAYRSTNFNAYTREVWLKEGEAFFDVAHNPQKPFIVNYDGMQSVVLGTSFNIKAYKALGESSVTVKTGRVMVKKGKQELAVINPNMRLLRSDKADNVKVAKADAATASAWTAGKITFSDAPFSEIVMRLKNNYDVEAELEGVSEDEVRLTATFEVDDKVEKIVEAVAGVNELQYRIEGKKIIFYKATK